MQAIEQPAFELIRVIVNEGLGSRVLRIAKKHGMPGGTILLGKGTIKQPLLELLALCDVRKEIVLMAADAKTCTAAMEAINSEMKLHKPNHGIAYATPVRAICGSSSCRIGRPEDRETGGEKADMYESIVIIVEKGRGEAVVDAAAKAGSRGATIINARGSGVHETSKLFAMEIEPEKEMVLIISSADRSEAIIAAIQAGFDIDRPGSGIIFVQPVTRAYGLFGQ
ncbi:hypothetical protein SDC9_149782 [bioreactor metagenome]|uniref:Nitrogen regulatory protein P-II n=1 Tax=bioreactor metagenome TaxID=1076179 RepID=A0A645EM96_9ZZZZ